IQCQLSPSCCQLPPFESIPDYEHHYHTCHENVCSQCNRILPTKHILHLHLLEMHDSFWQINAEKKLVDKPMYECFVETCNVKSRTRRNRNRHLIHVHQYPKEFEFQVI
ncbi:hypothetical protein BC833DRAFT_519880, partial [Globomyces pollinis-pini]